MNKSFLFIAFVVFCIGHSFAQGIALTFQMAEKQGISIKYLDSTYKSGVHTDTAKAVFKTEAEQNALHEAYVQLLQDLGKFLSKNNFYWEKPSRCFNRIYFDAEGKIDYFLFNFLGKPEDRPKESAEIEFQRLLALFINEYKISLKPNAKFAQCSPTTYMPQK